MKLSKMKLNKIALCLVPLAFAVGSQAEQAQVEQTSQVTEVKNVEIQKNSESRISFSAQVEKEVNFDLMRVTLYLQESGNTLKDLNKSINEKVNAAVEKIKKNNAIEIKDNSRNTYTEYDKKGKQKGWTERAELVLESRDFEALAQVISDINDNFAIESMSPQLSSEARAKVEDEMIQSVMAKFNHKAKLLQQSVNAKGYLLENLSLQTPESVEEQYYPQPRMYAAKAVALSAESAEPTDSVQFERTKTVLKASVNASILLSY